MEAAVAGRGGASRNRTITLSDAERDELRGGLLRLSGPVPVAAIENGIVCQDMRQAIEWMPSQSVDLLFLDPPYNLTKTFGPVVFRERSTDDYAGWLESWFPRLMRLLTPTASVYICGDWRSSPAIYAVAVRYLKIRNRITWEREKGRGAVTNWKNCAEDIWYCTVSDTFTFNVDAVKLRRKVIAPYTDENGDPKDWVRDSDGSYRITHPSNVWTDLTVPFWSMAENTQHPTQKPEKLLAKIILASTNVGDMVFDPFAGSGTACVVARKLGRRFVGMELDEVYCCLARKRLLLAEVDPTIQGYARGVFWERNSDRSASGSRCRRPGIRETPSGDQELVFE